MPPCGGIEAKPRRETDTVACKKVNRTPILRIHSDPSSPFIGLFRNHRIPFSFPRRKEGGKKKERTRGEKRRNWPQRERERERKNKSEFGKIGDETWMEKEEKGREKI